MKPYYALLAFPASIVYAQSSSNGGGDDTQILNFALNFTNLQSAFYNQSLSQFDERSFNSSGYGPFVRTGFVQINQNKAAQAALLGRILGGNATATCSYNFTSQVTNITDFTEGSQIVENIGTSAWIGLTPNLTNTTHQTVAGSILATDARYASWAATVNGVQPWSSAFDIPLTPNQVLTLTSPYVVSCPQTGGSPFAPGNNLTVHEGQRGSNATFAFNNTSSNGQTPLFAVFFQGLNIEFVPLTNGNAVVPENLTGITYAVVTNSSTTVSDNTTVAGPAVLNLSVPMNGTNSTGGPAPASTSSSAASSTGTSSSSMPPITSSSASLTGTASATSA